MWVGMAAEFWTQSRHAGVIAYLLGDLCVSCVCVVCVCEPTNYAGSEPGWKAWKHPLCVFLPVFDQADWSPLFEAGWLNLCECYLAQKKTLHGVRYTNEGLNKVFHHITLQDLIKTSHWPC